MPVALAPPPLVPGGSAPLPGMAVSTRATPGAASSRYFVTNCAQEMGTRTGGLASPNSTVSEMGPTSNVATPWNFGTADDDARADGDGDGDLADPDSRW